MFLQLDEDNYVVGYAMVGGVVGGVEVMDSMLDQIEPSKIGFYTYVDGVITLDQERYTASIIDTSKDVIRERRGAECFQIINRGRPWYDLWTAPQYTSIKTWYQGWLDAPASGVIPVRPLFLDSDPAHE